MDMGDEAEATGSDPGEQRIGNKVLLNFHLYAEYHSRPRAWGYQNYMYLQDRMCLTNNNLVHFLDPGPAEPVFVEPPLISLPGRLVQGLPASSSSSLLLGVSASQTSQ